MISKILGMVIGNFVEKENIHLTLKFLGNIPEEKIKDIEKKLSEIDFSSFGAHIGEIGFFPSQEHVKIVWVELLSDKTLPLKKLMDDTLDSLGFPPDNKEFNSHITIARIKEIKNKQYFFDKIKKLKIKKTDFNFKYFSLIKSELRRGGPVYKLIKKFELK